MKSEEKRNKVTKEEFNWIWSESSKENILNQFYYDYCTLRELIDVVNEAIKVLEEGITFCENDSQGVYDKCNLAINREKRVLEILKGAIDD